VKIDNGTGGSERHRRGGPGSQPGGVLLTSAGASQSTSSPSGNGAAFTRLRSF